MKMILNFSIVLVLLVSYSWGEDRSCQAPPSVENGDIITPERSLYLRGSVVEYRCQDHHSLEGSNTITCQDGKWTEPPTCREIAKKRLSFPFGFYRSCQAPPSVENGDIITPERSLYSRGSVVEYRCQDHHSLEGSNTITCQGGKWTEPPTCRATIAAKCRKPPVISHGDVINFLMEEYSSGSTVEYKCQSFYEMEGSSQVTCQDGNWSAPPTCLEPCIVTLADLEENNIKLRWTKSEKQYIKTGSTIEFACKDGYQKDSQMSKFQIQCSKGKLEYPRCVSMIAAKCRKPPVISHGDVINFLMEEYSSGSTVEYKCQSFYEMEGSSQVTCQDGNWSAPPTCLEPCKVTLEDLEENNIEVWTRSEKQYFKSGSTIKFVCKFGYRKDLQRSQFQVQCLEGKLKYPRCVYQAAKDYRILKRYNTRGEIKEEVIWRKIN
ncbi:coagulation factor XIII B chain-like isoform X3 [Dromiciops gliroides]|uniref:coagulation factor XIII B chain-like isoform X3 n=1 Tax=Dromiciops gliroides TaxID=33562 RepID=UPI001CC65E96|nr:coagulation factor XIII B chain-like isoform X3 [Dromiciops gliroides]